MYWEVVDGMAGAGSVVDARPIDGGGAFELVLELGNNVLVVEDLKRQISHTAMVPIAPDRIQINWSPS